MNGSSICVLASADLAEDVDESEKARWRGLLLWAVSDSFMVAERPGRPGLDIITLVCEDCRGWRAV